MTKLGMTIAVFVALFGLGSASAQNAYPGVGYNSTVGGGTTQSPISSSDGMGNMGFTQTPGTFLSSTNSAASYGGAGVPGQSTTTTLSTSSTLRKK